MKPISSVLFTAAVAVVGCSSTGMEGSTDSAPSGASRSPTENPSLAPPSTDIVETTSDLVRGVGTFQSSRTDWSGTVEIRTYVCNWVYGQHLTTDCVLPDGDDMVVVGGGASIYGPPWSPGALLTASYPLNASTWRASSKDHMYTFPHYLRSTVLGMRLTGVPNLRSMVSITEESRAGNISHSVNSGEIMLGGGCYTTYTGNGYLLYYSIPYPGSFLSGGPDLHSCLGTDHIAADPSGSTHAVTIALPQCPDGFGGCLQNGRFEWNGPSASGYVDTTMIVDQFSGWTMSTVGGYAHPDTSNPAARLLVNLFPAFNTGNGGGAYVGSKDHGIYSPGHSIAYAYVLARQ